MRPSAAMSRALAFAVLLALGCGPSKHAAHGPSQDKSKDKGQSCSSQCKAKNAQCEDVCLQQDCDVAPSSCKSESDGCSVQCKKSLDVCLKGC